LDERRDGGSAGDEHACLVRDGGEAMSERERCAVCDDETGNGGRYDGSQFDHCNEARGGAYCEQCWIEHLERCAYCREYETA
jgi:hypothetical protein